MKTCSKCDCFKPLEDFPFRSDTGNRRGCCKQCENSRSKEKYLRNPGKKLAQNFRWKKANPEAVRRHAREAYWKNPEPHRECARAWNKTNRPKVNARKRVFLKKKYAEDPLFRLETRLRCVVNKALSGKIAKSARTIELLGCDIESFKRHLESLFRPGMSWSNHGRVWHIDHIRPISSFNLTDPNQQKVCFRWANQQPLFALENLQKSDKYDSSPEPENLSVAQ